MVQISPKRDSSILEDRIVAAKTGEEWAWTELYNDLIGPITGYLRQRGAADPEDLASEVFLQLARDIHRFEGDASGFRSWAFVIAHRRMIDARRATGRRPKLADDDAIADDSIPGGDVEVEAIEVLTSENVNQILIDLTETQREVLALRIIGDLSLEETAKVMGKRVGAIKALQRRALSSVRGAIESGRVTL